MGIRTYCRKHVVCLLLVVCLVIGMVPGVAVADEVSPSFADIAGHWAYGAIGFMVECGYMQGTSDTTFAPNLAFSRAMAATILYRMAGEPEIASASAFTDVEPERWYSDAVAWAHDNDIVRGVGGGRFAPMVNITRQEMATILYRFATAQGYDVTLSSSVALDFPDANLINDWAGAEMGWAVYSGIMVGTDAGMLNPHGNATRAEAATLLMRFVEQHVTSVPEPEPQLDPELEARIRKAYLQHWQEKGGSQEYTVDDLHITFSATYSNGVVVEVFRPHLGPPLVISIVVGGYIFYFATGEVTLFFYHIDSSDIMQFDIAFERNLISQEELGVLWSRRGS